MLPFLVFDWNGTNWKLETEDTANTAGNTTVSCVGNAVLSAVLDDSLMFTTVGVWEIMSAIVPQSACSLH